MCSVWCFVINVLSCSGAKAYAAIGQGVQAGLDKEKLTIDIKKRVSDEDENKEYKKVKVVDRYKEKEAGCSNWKSLAAPSSPKYEDPWGHRGPRGSVDDRAPRGRPTYFNPAPVQYSPGPGHFSPPQQPYEHRRDPQQPYEYRRKPQHPYEYAPY